VWDPFGDARPPSCFVRIALHTEERKKKEKTEKKGRAGHPVVENPLSVYPLRDPFVQKKKKEGGEKGKRKPS